MLKNLCSIILDNIMATLGTIRIPFPNTSIKNESNVQQYLHCPVEKQIIVPLSANQMGRHIAAECCGSHAG